MQDYPYAAFEHLPEGFAAADHQGLTTAWNKAMEQMTGEEQAQVLGQPLWEVLSRKIISTTIHPNPQEVLQQQADQARQGEAGTFETQIQPAQGAAQRVELSFFLLELPDGRGVGLIVRPTEARRAEQEILMLQAQALDSAAHGFAITSTKGEILWVNPAFSAMTGYTLDEVRGKTFRILKSGKQKLSVYQRLWETVLSGQIWHGELINRRKDGSLYVEHQTITPVLDEQGQVSHFIAIMTDITRQKQAEQSEQEQRAMVESLHGTIAALSSVPAHENVLDFILQSVRHVVNYEAANIMLVEADQARVIHAHGYGEQGQDETLSLQPYPVADLAGTRQVIECARPLVIEDTAHFDGWVRHAGTDWIRAHLSAPIRRGEQVIGLINVDSSRPGAFSPADGDRLQTFADQAAAVLESARLFAETRRHAFEMEALSKISASLRRSLTRNVIAGVILDHVEELFSTRGARLALVEPETARFRGGYTRGIWAEASGATHDEPAAGVLAICDEGTGSRLLATGQPYSTNDISQDLGLEPQQELAELTPAVAAVPLIAHEKITGALWVGREKLLEPESLSLLTQIADIAATALHRALLFEQTQQRLQRLTALRRIDMAITSSQNLDVSLQVLLDEVINQLQVDAAAVLLLDPETRILSYNSGRGFRTAGFKRAVLTSGEGLAGQVVQSGKPLHIPDINRISLHPELRQLFAVEGFAAYHAAPLVTKGELRGVLETFHSAPLRPNREWMDFIEALAGQAAIAVDNAMLYEDLQQTNQQLSQAYAATLEGWSRALELRDHETQGHTERVTELTLHMAEKLGLGNGSLVHIERGALLHDIGKMAIPDYILLKPGPLNEDEWEIMRMHPVYAYQLLSSIPFLRPALDIPYAHHERWDGSGYPRGLVGEQIPKPARLFAVVDVWDALLSDRPYRPAWPQEDVKEYIQRHAGRHFDPEAVRVFFETHSDQFVSYPA